MFHSICTRVDREQRNREREKEREKEREREREGGGKENGRRMALSGC